MTWRETYTLELDSPTPHVVSDGTLYSDEALFDHVLSLMFHNQRFEWRLEATWTGYISLTFDHDGTKARWEFHRA